MSSEITRMYANAATAAKAADELHEEGYDDLFVVNAPSTSDVPVSAIAAQIAAGRVHLPDARIYAKGVAAGHSLVTVHAPFGTGKVAEYILDSHGPIDSGMPKAAPDRMWDEATPLSSTLVLPVLINDPDPASRALGIPALTSSDCGPAGTLARVKVPSRAVAVARSVPATRTSAPRVLRQNRFERATRLCSTSPQMTTVWPSTRPLRRMMVSESSKNENPICILLKAIQSNN